MDNQLNEGTSVREIDERSGALRFYFNVRSCKGGVFWDKSKNIREFLEK